MGKFKKKAPYELILARFEKDLWRLGERLKELDKDMPWLTPFDKERRVMNLSREVEMWSNMIRSMKLSKQERDVSASRVRAAHGAYAPIYKLYVERFRSTGLSPISLRVISSTANIVQRAA